MEPLPYDIKEQIIQCLARCFHYKDKLESFLRSAGIERDLAAKYRDEPKFVWARKLLNDLETDEGRVLQRKILTSLCRFRNLPDSEVRDKDSGLSVLLGLKEMANNYNIEYEGKKGEAIGRKNISENKERIANERNLKLKDLNAKFVSFITSSNRQKAGFVLEDILKELFLLSEIEYHKSYKTETQQIDGYFSFKGFDYLVEAKWRDLQPTEGDIGAFQRKVQTKLDGTRGVFVSIPGIRKEVISQFNGEGAKIIFITGEDLTHILEGRVKLNDALVLKIERAAKYGESYCSLI
jgi:hypothetical protein